MKLQTSIQAIEYFLPEKIVTNDDLQLENPQWDMAKIYAKVGVASRHVAGPSECASDLGVAAAEQLLRKSPLDRRKIDALIVCTQSPDYFLPTTACLMQERLALDTSIAAFDINLGCSGYIYGLATASSFIASGLFENILLICAETYSKYITKADRVCRPIFGDAGAATLLVKGRGAGGIGNFRFGSDGSGAENLIVAGGAHRKPGEPAVVKMMGPAVFMFTMSQVCQGIKDLLARNGRTIADIDHFFFHQASKLVLDSMTQQLSIPAEKVFRGFERIGNTVSASIPISLKQASDQGILRAGDDIVLAGFGVGYSWGACLVQWQGMKGES